jgi:signal transduction histidine kinase
MNRRRAPGLGPRLLTAQLLVLLTAVVTAAILAVAVGPTIFRSHLGKVSHDHTPEEAVSHAEQAFRSAGLIAITVALLVALVVALAVSVYATRRITRPVAALAAAASEVAAGRYEVQVPAPALGGEFDSLTTSFASMAERLQAVEATRRRLLADLAHEMRTPVATLDAYLEGVEDGLATLDVDTVGMLRGQTRRLARLADDISAVSRAEERQLDLHRTLIAPLALARSAVDAVADRYAAARVDLAVEALHEGPAVSVDPDRFGQVLGNLLDNALRHTPAGGRVKVTVSAAGSQVVFEVADTGEGIAAAHLPHLFERFYRVDSARDRSSGGSGIGLAIVKAVVEAHGGAVSADSPGLGAGTRFRVQVPAAA